MDSPSSDLIVLVRQSRMLVYSSPYGEAMHWEAHAVNRDPTKVSTGRP